MRSSAFSRISHLGEGVSEPGAAGTGANSTLLDSTGGWMALWTADKMSGGNPLPAEPLSAKPSAGYRSRKGLPVYPARLLSFALQSYEH